MSGLSKEAQFKKSFGAESTFVGGFMAPENLYIVGLDIPLRVRVIRAVPPRLKFGGGVQCSESGPGRFCVARVDNGTELPKPRTAAGLYPVVPTDIVARAGEKLARACRGGHLLR